MSKLLVVDDDNQLGQMLSRYLRELGHIVDYCGNGEDAMKLLPESNYELIILDWSMPGVSGYDVCTAYRAQRGQAPIIFLTGLSDVTYLELALGAGADDYMVKPFDLRELTARVNAILRRRTQQIAPELSAQGLTLILDRQIVHMEGRENFFVRLRPKECALLEYLLKHPDRTHSAQALFDSCWPSTTQVGSNSVRTWMGTLRSKLEQLGCGDLIQTVPGKGYFISKTGRTPMA